MTIQTSNWDDLLLSLEKALSSAKRLRDYYSQGNSTPATSIPLYEGLSVRKMLLEIAKTNGGKLVVKEAIGIVAANLATDRDTARNNIYSALYTAKSQFSKLSKGVYQLK